MIQSQSQSLFHDQGPQSHVTVTISTAVSVNSEDKYLQSDCFMGFMKGKYNGNNGCYS